MGPVGAAGAVVGGAVATAGAIATAPSVPSIVATIAMTIATTTITATAMAAATGRPMRHAITLSVRLAPRSVAQMASNGSASNLFGTEQKKGRLCTKSRLFPMRRTARYMHRPAIRIKAAAPFRGAIVRELQRFAISSSSSTETGTSSYSANRRRSSSAMSRVTSRDQP